MPACGAARALVRQPCPRQKLLTCTRRMHGPPCRMVLYERFFIVCRILYYSVYILLLVVPLY